MFKSSRIRTKTSGPISCIFSVSWLAGDIKELTHLSKRVEQVVPGVVVWLFLMVGASDRVNLIAPFPLGQNCLRKITINMTRKMTDCSFVWARIKWP